MTAHPPASLFTWGALGAFKAEGGFPESYPDVVRTFWAGRDHVHDLLVALLQSAQNSIVLNIFGYDDDAADGILRAKMEDPHIYVQMNLDLSQSKGVHERVLLAQWPNGTIGTSIAIGQSAHHAISHLKVCIVDGLYMVTGSTNWSLSGEEKQDNEVRLFRDPVMAHETRVILDINHQVMLAQMIKRNAP